MRGEGGARRARKPNDAAENDGDKRDTTTMSKGMARRQQMSARLHRTRGGDFRHSKLIVSMGGRRIFRHQVLCNQPRKRPIDPAPHVDFGKFFKLKPGVLAQIVVVRARGPLVRCQIAS